MSHAFSSVEQRQQDNEKHEYMIKVLRQVLGILQTKHDEQQRRQAAKAAKISNQRSKSTKSNSPNRFPQDFSTVKEEDEDEAKEQIDAAELEMQRETYAAAWKINASVDVTVRFEAEIDVSFYDALEALRDLCEQWQGMRSQVNQGWKDYAVGSIDLGAVAIMANTAIDLARHLEEAVRPLVARNDQLCRTGIWKDSLHLFHGALGSWNNIYSGLYHRLSAGTLHDFKNSPRPQPIRQVLMQPVG